MWISTQDAYRLVRAAAADLDAAELAVKRARSMRDALLAALSGQEDINDRTLAEAAAVARSRVTQVRLDITENGTRDARRVAGLSTPLPEMQAALAVVDGVKRITPGRRVLVS